MNGLSDIESALLNRLSMLRLGVQGAPATVDGLACASKTRVMTHLRSLRKPAAVVSYAGQKTSSAGRNVLFSVHMACESLRGDGEARTGGDDVVGMHSLLDLIRQNLDGTRLPCGSMLSLVSESAVSDDDRLIVFQQTYAVEETS